LLALGLLILAVTRIGTINEMREEYRIAISNPFEDENVRSELRIPTVALFTFRSLAIDYLWIRADTLQHDGQYFDALHLSRLICALQPHLTSVWDYRSYNMAYNISVGMPTWPERWNWVEAGYKLLRDEALVFNPQSPLLHERLAWIFEHKIGAISDDAHYYYKLRLASDMMPLLAPIDCKDIIRDSIITNEELAALAAAPHQWENLRKDPEMATLIDRIKKAVPDFTNDDSMFRGLVLFRMKPNEYPPPLHQVMADYSGTKTLRDLDLFVRARTLRQTWKLDPQEMIEVNKKYGPVDYNKEEEIHLSLDWRLPYTHALYWAVQGLKYAQPATDEALRLHRAVYHSLQFMLDYGYLQLYNFQPITRITRGEAGQEIFEKKKEFEMRIFISQDLRMFPIAFEATQAVLQEFIDKGERIPKGVEHGSINLAIKGIMNLYLAGHQIWAQQYLNYLQQRFTDPNPDRPNFNVSLETFVAEEMKRVVQDTAPKNTNEMINSFLRKSFFYYATGNDDMASVNEQYAQKLHKLCRLRYAEAAERLFLPDFPEMRWIALKNFMLDNTVDYSVKGLMMKRLQIDYPDTYQQVLDVLQKEQEETNRDSNTGP
jgi:hypothetical protein